MYKIYEITYKGTPCTIAGRNLKEAAAKAGLNVRYIHVVSWAGASLPQD